MTIPMTDTTLDLEKTTIARCVRRSPFRSWPAWVYFGVFLMSFGVFYIFWCTENLHDYVQLQLQLRNGTKAMSMWERPPAKLILEVYVFNFTNVEDFLSYRADKLHVEELGPYIYLETKKRINVVSENDTLTYQEENDYEWVGGRSEDDLIVMPNVPLLSSSAYATNLNFAAQLSLTALLSSFKEKSFIHVKAGDFFWGYDDSFFDVAKPFIRLKHDVPFEKFGILALKKGVDKDRITINAGTQDINKLGVFERLNGQSSHHVWGDERCDKLEGTDGSVFPPNLVYNRNDTLHIYAKHLCRSIAFEFHKHVTTSNIPILRYVSTQEMFSTKDNKCFCPKIGDLRVCPPKGIFDISVCANDSPMMMSLPHFLFADKSLLEQIDGLHPRIDDHMTYLDIYPYTATPIGGWSKIQINIQVRKAVGVPLLGRLKDEMILPLIWLNQGLSETDIPQNLQDILYQLNVTLRITEAVLQWSSLVGMILSMGALLVCFKKHRMEHPDVGLQMNLAEQNKLGLA
ncbi:scavenger receptor class B member 1-like [Odontomachus brunneus]|uniref:scavenger receptor class B member 1-like n=1 Tax=Odontomachus brunneus TaxID=486640 RepID=UPI0013F2802B|nr:scavenger receptor class B member 1-like [Odontomachus brunneus]